MPTAAYSRPKIMDNISSVSESFSKLMKETEVTAMPGQSAETKDVTDIDKHFTIDRRISLEINAASDGTDNLSNIRRTASLDAVPNLEIRDEKKSLPIDVNPSKAPAEEDTIRIEDLKSRIIDRGQDHSWFGRVDGALGGQHPLPHGIQQHIPRQISETVTPPPQGVAAAIGSNPMLGPSFDPNANRSGGTVTLECPPHLVGRVIGRKGDTILRLQEMTASRIIIDQNVPNNAPRHVIISGPSLHSVSSAVQLVQEVMANGPPWRHKIPSMHAQWNVTQTPHGRYPPQVYGPSGSSTVQPPAPSSRGSNGPSVHTPGLNPPNAPLPHGSGHSASMPGWHQPHVPYSPISQPPSYAFYPGVPPIGPHSQPSQIPTQMPAGGWMPQPPFNSGWTGTGAYYPPQGSPSSNPTNPPPLNPPAASDPSTVNSGEVWQEARTPEGYVYYVNKVSGVTTWYKPT